MADVLPFKKRSLKEKAKGRTLCSRGFHKWVVDKQQRFDVKQGRSIGLQDTATAHSHSIYQKLLSVVFCEAPLPPIALTNNED